MHLIFFVIKRTTYLEQFMQSRMPLNDFSSLSKKYCVWTVMQLCLDGIALKSSSSTSAIRKIILAGWEANLAHPWGQLKLELQAPDWWGIPIFAYLQPPSPPTPWIGKEDREEEGIGQGGECKARILETGSSRGWHIIKHAASYIRRFGAGPDEKLQMQTEGTFSDTFHHLPALRKRGNDRPKKSCCKIDLDTQTIAQGNNNFRKIRYSHHCKS